MATLKDLVYKAIADASFRKALSADPEKALEGFDLSDEEKTLFLNARGGDLSALLADLSVEKRVSKSGIGPIVSGMHGDPVDGMPEP